jgi:hypothetical protein
MHGRLSPIEHVESALFAGISQGFMAVRYHSLVVGTVPEGLGLTAWIPDGVVMALEHRSRPLHGVQFHPESIATHHGRRLIIDRLEGRPRGVDSGALGFLSVNGTADLSIVIRTLVASPHGLTVGAGGAIVAGSDPEAELAEMRLKARALLEAVGGTLEAGRQLAAT